jgi:hypothetical protein
MQDSLLQTKGQPGFGFVLDHHERGFSFIQKPVCKNQPAWSGTENHIINVVNAGLG